jgi:integrase
MARTTERLTALKVERLTEKPGMHADGSGLYLQVTDNGASWILRYMLGGRAREMGLGPLALFGLQEARAKALDARRLRHGGIDPIEARKAARLRLRLDAAKAMTFKQCAEAFIKAHRAGWHNGKHAAQWEATLATYAEPIIGALPVPAIDTALVLKVIEPIWTTKPETASRVCGRIESILDWAKVRGYRTGENPARWRGHLDKLLPSRSKVRRVKPHPALPFAETGTFMSDLASREGIAARALSFTILCAVRTGDIIGSDREEKPPMKWSHVDFSQRVWTIPSTKTDKAHRVPLSYTAVSLLKEMKALELGDIVFPGMETGQPLSNMAMTNVIRRMNEDRTERGIPRYVDPKQGGRDITVHGFRSTFRDWAAERTNFPNEMVEMALAHTVSDKVEAAYRRGDMFEKRRRLMDAWAEFCSKRAPAGTVVNLRQA